MKVRFTFRVETMITADTFEEAVEKFDNASFFNTDCGEGVMPLGFVEMESVENGENYDDLMEEYYNC